MANLRFEGKWWQLELKINWVNKDAFISHLKISLTVWCLISVTIIWDLSSEGCWGEWELTSPLNCVIREASHWNEDNFLERLSQIEIVSESIKLINFCSMNGFIDDLSSNEFTAACCYIHIYLHKFCHCVYLHKSGLCHNP